MGIDPGLPVVNGAQLEVGPNIVAVLVLLMPVITVAVNGYVLYRTRKTASVVAAVATTVEAVHQDTIQVNAAVNHKETGMPSLVQRVIDQDHRGIQLANDLATDRAYVNDALPLIAERLGVTLPAPPPPVAPAPVILPHADADPIRPVDLRDIDQRSE